MRALAFALLGLATIATLSAQDEDHISKASRKYDDSRRTLTEPPFGLRKVKKLLGHLKPTDIENQTTNGISNRAYSALNFNERCTYNLLHGEMVSQNCDGMPILEGEQHMIFPHPPDAFDYGNAYWSDKQLKFLHSNRTRVVALVKSTIQTRHQVGVNLKQAILELHANALIPDMLAAYRSGQERDQDILTTCMLLMKDGHYKPFLATKAYQTLYGPKASYQSYLYADAGTKKLVMRDALAFSRSRSASR